MVQADNGQWKKKARDDTRVATPTSLESIHPIILSPNDKFASDHTTSRFETSLAQAASKKKQPKLTEKSPAKTDEIHVEPRKLEYKSPPDNPPPSVVLY